MLALASNPAEAKKSHKHEARPKATPHAQAHAPKHRTHRHHAHYTWVWKWRAGHYDVHGHWIRGKWIYSRIRI